MEKIVEIISAEFAKAFTACGYDSKYAKVTVSNRPDLCEYQCNGAMAAAKEYRKAPIMIANDIVSKLQDSPIFDQINAVNPGFINFNLNGKFVCQYVQNMVYCRSRYI